MELHSLLRFAHLAGFLLIGAGLIGVFVADMRARRATTLDSFAAHVMLTGLFYDGLAVPGAILLLGSGGGLIALSYDGWSFLEEPWLVGMISLFAFEFVEGNTLTRIYFRQLRRLTLAAVAAGRITPELAAARRDHLAGFAHFLDLPMLMLILSLGVFRPDSWDQFLYGAALAIALAGLLNITVPRLYPWRCTPR